MSFRRVKSFLRRHGGKTGGILLGLLLRTGFFGPLLGLVLGFFWDEFLEEKQIRRGAREFLMESTPEALNKIPAAERPGFLIMIIVRHYFLTLKTGRAGWNRLEPLVTHAVLGCLEKSRDLQRGMERAAALPPQPPSDVPLEMAGTLIRDDQKQKVVEVLLGLSPEGDKSLESRRFLRRLCGVWDVASPRNDDPDREYHLLGLPRSAPVEEVKQTFRTLAAQFHPDTSLHLTETQKSESEEAFRKIRDAYEKILKDKAGED